MKVPLISKAAWAALVTLFSATIALANAPLGAVVAAAPDVVPGEILIQLTSDAFGSAAYRADLGALGKTGLAALDTRLALIGAREVSPVFDTKIDPARKSAQGMDRVFRVRYGSGQSPEEAAAAAMASGEVVFAEPNRIARAMLTPNDPTYPSQWAHNNTGQAIRYGGGTVGTVDCDTDTDQAWDLQTGSSALILAIIDTGVDTGHQEFSGKVVAGYDFVNNDSNPTDDNGHGTSCAGIAVGIGNNSQGIAGVAWGVKLMPVKVLDSSGGGTYTAVANGITWAADNGAKVLSLSLGGGASSTLQTAVDYAYGRGCALFCATGNANRSSLDYPAAYSNTIAVGALSPCNERKSTSSCDGETWWGSNYGTGLDFLAPGVRIHTTDIRGSGGFGSGDYITDFNGTSSATPHAAGIGALVWSQNSSLTNAELRTVLRNNCDDIGSSGYDTSTGYGRMNAYRAVQNAGGGGGPTPVTIFSENFETNAVPGSVWSVTDANSSNGLDYWGDQASSAGARVHGGSWSAYCADNSDVSGQKYDHNMSADMTLINSIGLSGYTDVQLSFWIWYKTANSSDYLAFQYWNGSAWVEQQRWSGNSSTWRNLAYTLTGFSTLRFRFFFYSNGSRNGEGAYVDDIVLTGTPTSFAPGGSPSIAFASDLGESTPAVDRSYLTASAAPSMSAGPNPFRERTAIRIDGGRGADVRVAIFSVDGRLVRTLRETSARPGTGALTWEGDDAEGRRLPSGSYYARLLIEGRVVETTQLLLLR